MSLISKIKKSFNNYLERVAKENKELFGEGRPDCCSLNRQQIPSTSTKSEQHNERRDCPK